MTAAPVRLPAGTALGPYEVGPLLGMGGMGEVYFAFGSLLYEALMGRPAFDGATQAQIMAAVMTSTPPPVSTVRPGRYIPAYAFATVYAGLGDKDKAFHYLDRLREEHSAHLDYINIEPTLDGLRDDPRFLELLRRVNLPFVDVNRGRSDAHPRS
jgi:hypothetical protein